MIERRELHRLIKTHMNYDRYFIKDGQITPQYLTEEERKLLTEGLETSIDKIVLEVFNSQERTQKITGKPSEELVNRIKDIRGFQKIFASYLSERPLVF